MSREREHSHIMCFATSKEENNRNCNVDDSANIQDRSGSVGIAQDRSGSLGIVRDHSRWRLAGESTVERSIQSSNTGSGLPERAGVCLSRKGV